MHDDTEAYECNQHRCSTSSKCDADIRVCWKLTEFFAHGGSTFKNSLDAFTCLDAITCTPILPAHSWPSHNSSDGGSQSNCVLLHHLRWARSLATGIQTSYLG